LGTPSFLETDVERYRFHAETSILTTIFGLLFWDIIFAPVRGAFETKFQSAPLDIVDDSFYYARKEQIEARMEEMKEGKAVEVLERHYAAHSERKTWCIGVRWDICTLQDLTEIIEV
jgi:fanconi-associated nuclease 1